MAAEDLSEGVDEESDLSSCPPSPTQVPVPLPPNLSIISPQPSTTTPTKKKYTSDLERRKARRKATQTLSRNRKREEAGSSFTVNRMREKIRERYLEPSTTKQCDFKLNEAKATKRGFVGRRDQSFSWDVYTLDELTVDRGFELLDWNGIDPTVLVDSGRRIIGLLAGNPGGDDWDSMVQEAVEAVEHWRGHCRFPYEKKGKRSQGEFDTLACGVSYGGGQKKPTNIKNTKGNQAIVNHLCNLRCFKRVSGFSTSVLATCTPKLYEHYASKMTSLYDSDPSLIRPFPSSTFAASTFNMGPETVCYLHIDQSNLIYGMCSIWAAGTYNCRTGGHLVLWDLSLVIAFPPGSMIMIPSAVLSHSNTAILPTERCYSFTQYTAGGLFRWVENGFMTSEHRQKTMTPEQQREEAERDVNRWKEGIALLPIIPAPAVAVVPPVS